MVALYIIGWVAVALSFIYCKKNLHKFGDEDYSTSSWVAVAFAGFLCVVISIIEVVVSVSWLLHYAKIV